MNIERYAIPVIAAIGLHGLLFVSSIDPVVIFPTRKPIRDKTTEMPIEVIQVTASDPVQGESAGGGAPNPLPPSPEMPRELPKETIFRVDVQESMVPIKPVASLAKIPATVGLPDGDGSGLGNGLRGVFRSGDLDHIPRATVQPAPNYPGSMREINGSVTVEFVVDTAGRVVTAEAVRWTHREFVDPAVRAVLRWRFEPGTLNGRRVSFRMAVPIEFNAER
ncbi:MAG TPA: TonB family protein [Lacunisphaera sp.]|nr:TonB family protein [Lacunisphaera sp.]